MIYLLIILANKNIKISSKLFCILIIKSKKKYFFYLISLISIKMNIYLFNKSKYYYQILNNKNLNKKVNILKKLFKIIKSNKTKIIVKILIANSNFQLKEDLNY